MQTRITDSTLAVSPSFGAIPRLSCWPEHKQLCGTNPTETNARSWQTFPSTYHANSKPKHFLLKISRWVAFQIHVILVFFFLTMFKYLKEGSKWKKKQNQTTFALKRTFSLQNETQLCLGTSVLLSFWVQNYNLSLSLHYQALDPAGQLTRVGQRGAEGGSSPSPEAGFAWAGLGK